jgi:DNA-3-methyladenine glycosylase I
MGNIGARCAWAAGEPGDAMVRYHDEEWGVPQHDDHRLFEFLILEGAQAGLSWATILARREHYRAAFAGFDPARVARFTARDAARLLGDAGIIRNRLKIAAAIGNAQAFLALQAEHGSFDRWLWDFAPRGRRPAPRRMADVPAETAESQALSRELRRRGFRFVGPTICYAYMQAVGMVNDHLATCPARSRAGR